MESTSQARLDILDCVCYPLPSYHQRSQLPSSRRNATHASTFCCKCLDVLDSTAFWPLRHTRRSITFPIIGFDSVIISNHERQYITFVLPWPDAFRSPELTWMRERRSILKLRRGIARKRRLRNGMMTGRGLRIR